MLSCKLKTCKQKNQGLFVIAKNKQINSTKFCLQNKKCMTCIPQCFALTHSVINCHKVLVMLLGNFRSDKYFCQKSDVLKR